MTTTASGESSSLLQRFHNHQRSSSSPCNLNLRLRFSPAAGNEIPKPSAAAAAAKKKCSCSPTTHPGSFRCAYHRRLANGKSSEPSTTTTRRRNFGLNLRKLALMNSLAKIGSFAAERFREILAASLVKPSNLDINPRREFKPRRSRFYNMHKDQD